MIRNLGFHRKLFRRLQRCRQTPNNLIGKETTDTIGSNIGEVDAVIGHAVPDIRADHTTDQTRREVGSVGVVGSKAGEFANGIAAVVNAGCGVDRFANLVRDRRRDGGGGNALPIKLFLQAGASSTPWVTTLLTPALIAAAVLVPFVASQALAARPPWAPLNAAPKPELMPARSAEMPTCFQESLS